MSLCYAGRRVSAITCKTTSYSPTAHQETTDPGWHRRLRLPKSECSEEETGQDASCRSIFSWQGTQRVSSGRASSRAAGICTPQSMHSP